MYKKHYYKVHTYLLKLVYSCLIIYFPYNFIHAQPPDTLWVGLYGNPWLHKIYSVRQTTDGGYIAAGYREYNDEDVYIVKTDSIGDVVWEKYYGNAGVYDKAMSVATTIDGGYIVTGRTQSVGPNWYNIWLLKTDANGDTMWSRNYGYHTGWCVQQTSDSGYIIGGFSLVLMRLIKTDSLGNVIWDKEYGVSTKGYYVQETSDGGYITVGEAAADLYVVKTDDMGDTLWTWTYGQSDYDILYSVVETPDSGYIAVGGFNMWYDLSRQTAGDVCIVKLNAVGDLLWMKLYDIEERDNVAYSICPRSNGDYTITGRSFSMTSGSFDTFLMEINPTGDTAWTSIIQWNGDDWSECIQETQDKGYIIAGWGINYLGHMCARLIKTAVDQTALQRTTPSTLPLRSKLHVSPNPFKINTEITFFHNKPESNGLVKLRIYDVKGTIVRDFTSSNLTNIKFIWDGTDLTGRQLPNGVYFVIVQFDTYSDVMKMILIR